MPKKPPKNAYFFYMLHFKDEQARRGRRFGGLPEVSIAASESWKAMTPQQKQPFEKMAKDAKHGPQKVQEKYTSQGIPVSQIRKEDQELMRAQKNMKATILDMVKSSYINNTMGSQEYYFIDGNYFCVTGTMEKVFIPAEIAMIKFTFEDGVVHKFHTNVNPEKLPLGFQYDAKSHAEETHQMKIPPNASGEKNFSVILNEITRFLGNARELPPLFTLKEKIPMIESFLNQFCNAADVDPKRYRVFPIHQLFYDVKEEAAKNSIDNKPGFQSIHVAEAQFNRDQYVYLKDTACNYHEDLDCSKFCALSNVQRWAFTFADHICLDLNIPLIAGQHLPPEVDVSEANSIIYSRSTFADDQSQISDSADTYTTEPRRATRSVAGGLSNVPSFETKSSLAAPILEHHRSARDDSMASSSTVEPATWRRYSPSHDGGVSSSNDDEFPSLGSHGRKPGPSKRHAGRPVRNVDDPWNTSSSSADSNPWNQLRGGDEQRDKDGFPNDFDFIPLGRSGGRGSELFQNKFQSTRGRVPHNDRSRSDKHHVRSPREDNRYHPWKSETRRDPRREH